MSVCVCVYHLLNRNQPCIMKYTWIILYYVFFNKIISILIALPLKLQLLLLSVSHCLYVSLEKVLFDLFYTWHINSRSKGDTSFTLSNHYVSWVFYDSAEKQHFRYAWGWNMHFHYTFHFFRNNMIYSREAHEVVSWGMLHHPFHTSQDKFKLW